jgi:hypothetical protein
MCGQLVPQLLALKAMVEAYKDSCPDAEQPSMVKNASALLAEQMEATP